jgi:predicted acylesterase/phospholipase RssA
MKKKKALLLGAGGPLGGLEAGALIALDEMGVSFDVISGACIGSIIALAYASPANGMSRRESLEKWCNASGLSDPIYHGLCESNYKVFQKNSGPLLNDISDMWLKTMTGMNPFYTINPKNETERFWSDIYLYWLTLLTPGVPTSESKSLSRIAPFLDNFIDFEKLKNVKEDVYINAMNVTDKKIALFNKNEITMEHAIAGSSLFFICDQKKIGEKYYAEGSYIDSLNYKGVIDQHEDVDTIVVMNIMNRQSLIRPPRNLYDAWNLSIMLPFMTIAEDDTSIFLSEQKSKRRILQAKFEIPEHHFKYALDWSASNFHTLRDIGYDAGMKLFKEQREFLIEA